jgi:hypothetical protein
MARKLRAQRIDFAPLFLCRPGNRTLSGMVPCNAAALTEIFQLRDARDPYDTLPPQGVLHDRRTTSCPPN